MKITKSHNVNEICYYKNCKLTASFYFNKIRPLGAKLWKNMWSEVRWLVVSVRLAWSWGVWNFYWAWAWENSICQSLWSFKG